MANKKFIISGTGCALADFLYTNVSFHSPSFEKYRTRKPGDGGLSPGKLVFTEELEQFAKVPYPQILNELTDGTKAASFNIGGPSLVSLIHASQMLEGEKEFEVKFYGISGKDETSVKIRQLLKKTPVDFSGYLAESKKPTPFTHVLSDPDFDNGHGERTFINNIGAAWNLTPGFLPGSFFESDMVCLGGTAITPNLHDNLHVLLEKAKNRGAFTLVNTVFDFRNEKRNPENPWPLGNSEWSFPNIDILIMDKEEALKISGKPTVSKAIDFFTAKTSAYIITQGADPVIFNSNGEVFDRESGSLKVSEVVTQKIQNKEYNGDTTGCGDNFVGGVIASVAKQMQQNPQKKLNLKAAVISGICSGGFACSCHGGTWFEKTPGEKYRKIENLIDAYHKQLRQK
ncbi:MAG: carbohydrate kinase family protein [Mariniphaga sp.]